MKTDSIEKIKAAIIQLEGKGIKPTQKKVSETTGLSIITIRRYWKDRLSSTHSKRISSDKERISPDEKRISSNPAFERLKRYKPSGNLQLNSNHLQGD